MCRESCQSSCLFVGADDAVHGKREVSDVLGEGSASSRALVGGSRATRGAERCRTYAFFDIPRIFLPYFMRRKGMGTKTSASPARRPDAPGVLSFLYI